MIDCADGARQRPDERLPAVAAILAIGILRLRNRAALPTEMVPTEPAQSSSDGLEVSLETRLSVRPG